MSECVHKFKWGLVERQYCEICSTTLYEENLESQLAAANARAAEEGERLCDALENLARVRKENAAQAAQIAKMQGVVEAAREAVTDAIREETDDRLELRLMTVVRLQAALSALDSASSPAPRVQGAK